MKNNINKLLIISIIVSIVSIILCNLSWEFSDFNLFTLTTKLFDENSHAGMILLPMTIMLDFSLALIYLIFLLLIPAALRLIIVSLVIIARLFQIGHNKKWKDTTSKVFIYISFALQILLALYFILFFINTLNLILLLVVVGVVVEIILFIKEFKNIRVEENNQIEISK